jgi:hypothetical protein
MPKEVKRKTLHIITATIFTIVTFVHALRIGNGWPLQLGNLQFPMLLSWIVVFITGSLAVLMWRSSK